jgi:hypothetical protein
MNVGGNSVIAVSVLKDDITSHITGANMVIRPTTK